MNLTPEQFKAVDSVGNVVVVAGAGTGKTKTLVERCIKRICASENPISVDQLLVVTFTKAAATEVRKRIRDRLEEELQKNPTQTRIEEQIELLDHAHISTLHSFCNHLIREHFYSLALDPQSKLMDEGETTVLMDEVMAEFLEDTYQQTDATGENLRRLVLDYFSGDDRPLRELLGKLHDFTQTRQEAATWYESQENFYDNPHATYWQELLPNLTQMWVDRWFSIATNQSPLSPAAGALIRIFNSFKAGLETYQKGLQELSNYDQKSPVWIRGTKGKYFDPIKPLFEEAKCLLSYYPTKDGSQPLQEDWDCVRSSMLTLLRTARAFGQVYAEKKKLDGLLDFHDLEQFTIRLLWDELENRHTAIADKWRQQFAYICVDEYQDINPAQDKIIRSLGRSSTNANRFLVGDIKQSIYGFRQAAPQLFQSYENQWSQASAHQNCIYLKDNFRSHEAILRVVNGLFSRIMTGDSDGVLYDSNHHLHFGNPDNRPHLHYQPGEKRSVEILLWSTEDDSASSEEDDEKETEQERSAMDLANIAATEAEALLVARRFKRFVDSKTIIHDPVTRLPREVGYGDMAILLRNPASRLEGYASVFHREGIPLQAKRTGFYESIEVLDLLHLLEILDNPLQDIPGIAVLRSPLVGLSLSELAQIRCANREGCFWVALRGYVKSSPADSLGIKLLNFLAQWRRWRSLARHLTIHKRLEMILAESHYIQWLHTQDRADQRCKNIEQLVELSRAFGRRQGGSLYHFVSFVQKRRDLLADESSVQSLGDNAVRLMSIHGSKGLEFPVVAIASLGGTINDEDLRQPILIDNHWGLCPTVHLPQSGQRYESLLLWHARQEAKKRFRHEEMRLLYVAMTRAQEKLFLVGSATDKKREKWLTENKGLKARSYLDWIGPWMAAEVPDVVTNGNGNGEFWSLWSGSENPKENSMARVAHASSKFAESFSTTERSDLRTRLLWTYPHQDATQQPAKTTVSELRKNSFRTDGGEESQLCEPSSLSNKPFPSRRERVDELPPQKIGEVYHRFLELITPSPDFSLPVLDQERQRLVSNQTFKPLEANCLDLTCISRFWNSPLGLEILSHWTAVRRELPFTMRLRRTDLEGLNISLPRLPEDDFIIVQGMVDLVVILPSELWVLDFKTDRGSPQELDSKTEHYRTQLNLYSVALSRIYNRPVTKVLLNFLHHNDTHDLTFP